MPSGFFWNVSPQQAAAEWAAQLERKRAMIRAKMEQRSVEIEEWMKQNASWEDQTGNARRMLTAVVIATGDTFAVQVSHGVPYGADLEFQHAGAYAILGPAIDHWMPILWEDIRQIVNG